VGLDGGEAGKAGPVSFQAARGLGKGRVEHVQYARGRRRGTRSWGKKKEQHGPGSHRFWRKSNENREKILQPPELELFLWTTIRSEIEKKKPG